MSVIVVSHVPSLAAALASRINAVGLEPEDVAAYLESEAEIAGAIIDGASDDPTIEIATAIRRHDPWCPMILLLAGDSLPERETTDSLEPIRLVRRPFTTATVVDHMVSMQRTGPPRPTRVLADNTVVKDDVDSRANLTEPDVQAPAVEAVPGERTRWGRRRPGSTPDASRALTVSEAVSVLLTEQLPPPVTDAAQQVADVVAALVTPETAIAVLVRQSDTWHVEAGRGVRNNEVRTPIGPTHWLAKHVDGRDTAVVVSGTDVARQELTGAPLIHHEYWMATTMHGSSVMVVIGRSEPPPFEVSDAVELSDALRSEVSQVDAARAVRNLARRLEPHY